VIFCPYCFRNTTTVRGRNSELTERNNITTTGVFSYASRTEPLFACLEYLPVILAVLLFMAFPLYKLLPHASHALSDPEQHRFDMQAETSNVSNPTLVQPGSKLADGK
jgi:hypothetical protein